MAKNNPINPDAVVSKLRNLRDSGLEAREVAALVEAVSLLKDAVRYKREDWEADESINGAELVDFFGEWRQRVKRVLGGTS